MKPKDPSPQEPAEAAKPVFRSYFELLEAKYSEDGEGAPRSTEPVSPAKPKASAEVQAPAQHATFAREPRRHRPSGLLWVVAVFALIVIGAGVATYLSRTPVESAAPEAPQDAGAPAPAPESGPAPGAAAVPDDEPAQASPTPPRRATPDASTPPPPRPSEPQAPAAADGRSPSPEDAALTASTTTEPPLQTPTSETPTPATSALETPTPAPETTPPPPSSGPSATPAVSQDATATANEARAEQPIPPSPSFSSPVNDPALPAQAESSTANPPSPLGPRAASDETVPASRETIQVRKVFAPQPDYPEEARSRGEQGTVTVMGRITTSGTVRDARVVEGVSSLIDRAALEAFRTWQFLPAKRGGRAIESSYRVAFRFTLDDAAPPDAPAPGAANSEEEADSQEEASSAEPLPFGGDFEPPTRLATPLPTYPRSAWATGVSGNVVLEIVVDPQGQVGEIRVIQGLPNGISEAAVSAVQRWRFRPATKNGQPVTVRHRVSLRFAP